MTVAELIRLLKNTPQDAEVCVDRSGAHDSAKSVFVYESMGTLPAQVFISSDESS